VRGKNLTGREGDAKRALRVKVISSSHPGGKKNMIFSTLGRIKIHRGGVGASVLTFGAFLVSGGALIVRHHPRNRCRGLDRFAFVPSIDAFTGRRRRLLGEEGMCRGTKLTCGQLCTVIRRATVAPAVVRIVPVPAVLPDRSRTQG